MSRSSRDKGMVGEVRKNNLLSSLVTNWPMEGSRGCHTASCRLAEDRIGLSYFQSWKCKSLWHLYLSPSVQRGPWFQFRIDCWVHLGREVTGTIDALHTTSWTSISLSSAGILEHKDRPLSAVKYFTQADINRGKIMYRPPAAAPHIREMMEFSFAGKRILWLSSNL